jgi:AraC-like DNA-binding protein
MARDAFRDIAPLLDAACGSTLDTPLGHLLGDYMMALEHNLPDVTEADFSRRARAVGTMVAAAPSAERVTVAGAQIDVGRKERVRRVIRKHLRTLTFRPSILCRLVGMSRSSLYRLYRLFEDTGGGVARYIQRERLLEAHAVLTDPASTQSISSIADDFCFADVSSFSRTGATAMMRSLALSAGTDFGELIRGF